MQTVRTRLPGPLGSFDGKDHRRGGRVKASDGACTMGRILDISPRGARVLHAGKPPFVAEDEVVIVLRGPDESCRVRVRIAWVRKQGLRAHTVGFEFLEPIDEARTVAMSIVRYSIARSDLA